MFPDSIRQASHTTFIGMLGKYWMWLPLVGLYVSAKGPCSSADVAFDGKSSTCLDDDCQMVLTIVDDDRSAYSPALGESGLSELLRPLLVVPVPTTADAYAEEPTSTADPMEGFFP